MHRKQDVGYDEAGGKGNRRCGECVHFLQPDRCEVVEGEIDVDAVCQQFDKDIYKVACDNLFKGFAEKIATPQRGRIISDRGLISDDEISEDPAMLKKKRASHTKGIVEKSPYRRNAHETEKNGAAEIIRNLLEV